MTALPPATDATNAAATEGDVKNFLTAVRGYLSGLFGDTGAAVDARAALGVTALTAGNVVTALGYTPANAASAYSDHNHSGVYAGMNAIVAISHAYTTVVGGYEYRACTITYASGGTSVFYTSLPMTIGGGGGD